MMGRCGNVHAQLPHLGSGCTAVSLCRPASGAGSRGQAETTLSTVFFPVSALLPLEVYWFPLGACL